jgi:hypothetical protein
MQICDIDNALGCSFNGNPHMMLMGLTHIMRWHENDFGAVINLGEKSICAKIVNLA